MVLIPLIALAILAVAVGLLVLGDASAPRRRAAGDPLASGPESVVEGDPIPAVPVHLEGQLLLVHRSSPDTATIDGVRTDGGPGAPAGTPFAIDVRLADDDLTPLGRLDKLARWVAEGTPVVADLTTDSADAAAPNIRLRDGADEIRLAVLRTAGLGARD